MGFLFWRKRKGDEKLSTLKSEVKGSFSVVKQDMSKLSRWIKHLNSKDENHDMKMDMIYDEISEIRQDIDGIKNFISFFDTRLASKLSKHGQGLSNKQTAVQAVYTPVYTAVQTAMLNGLTSHERLIVWTLINTDLKLSYEDIAVLLGKHKSTVRSQLNNIKQKSGNIISEVLETNGKKRYYIEGQMKEMLFKTVKVRAKKIKKVKKGQKDD